MSNLVLGIETSCDECSASIVRLPHGADFRPECLGLSTHSQIEIHRPYGGIVPEVASRNHLETMQEQIQISIKEAGVSFSDINAIAVTNSPGLIGSLLVGVCAAKSLAYALDKPLIPINHLEGHALSIYLDQPEVAQNLEYPAVFALVSGGHTNLYFLRDSPMDWKINTLNESLLGRSRDDAAGEAFDKAAKIMGFPYPGGPRIDELAKTGKEDAFDLPRPFANTKDIEFSFSGLKTATAQLVQKLKKENRFDDVIPDLCASVQSAIVDCIIAKTKLALSTTNARSLVLVGGVAANSKLKSEIKKLDVPTFLPKLKYCTDNAAMIAGAGALRFVQGNFLKDKDILRITAIARSR